MYNRQPRKGVFGMERRAFTSIVSITIAFVILLSTFVLWPHFNNEEGKLIAESFGELPLSMKDNSYDNILYGDEIDTHDIIINYKNMNNNKRKGNLYLIVDPKSTVDELELSIVINGINYNINNLKCDYINDYLYYNIKSVEFLEYEELEFNINFNLNTRVSEESYFIYDFLIK